MPSIHARHSTDSNGKAKSQFFIGQRIVKQPANGVITLVGSGDGLYRHVEWYRSCNVSGVYYIYERDGATYFDLLRYKEKHYPMDNEIIIRHSDLMSHDFEKEPVSCVDFDSCDPFERVARKEGLTIEGLFHNNISVVALTFTSRAGVPSSHLAQLVHSKERVQSAITLDVLRRLFPQYKYELLRYRGVGITPMYTIVGTLR